MAHEIERTANWTRAPHSKRDDSKFHPRKRASGELRMACIPGVFNPVGSVQRFMTNRFTGTVSSRSSKSAIGPPGERVILELNPERREVGRGFWK